MQVIFVPFHFFLYKTLTLSGYNLGQNIWDTWCKCLLASFFFLFFTRYWHYQATILDKISCVPEKAGPTSGVPSNKFCFEKGSKCELFEILKGINMTQNINKRWPIYFEQLLFGLYKQKLSVKILYCGIRNQ